MTDLQMTQLCAEVMSVRLIPEIYQGQERYRMTNAYDPLHNDTQVMALVKKFQLIIGTAIKPTVWHVGFPFTPYWADNKDLNHAIVECVARMQLEKRK